MLEIPACNAGAYCEYLVCHETLQDRPCLRLPVCGETAVLCSLLSAFQPSTPLSPSSYTVTFSSLANRTLQPSRSFSFFATPFINYKLRAPEDKTLKNSTVSASDFRSLASILLPFKSKDDFYVVLCTQEQRKFLSRQRTHRNARVPMSNVISDTL